MTNDAASRRAFKLAFMQKCAEAGHTLEETKQIATAALSEITKQAFSLSDVTGPVTSVGGKALDVAGNVLSPLSTATLSALAFGPPALGLMGGYSLARATDIDDTDVAQIRKARLIDEYRRQTQRLLAQQKSKGRAVRK